MPYCQHCGDYFDEMKVKTQHVRNCLQNPRIIAKLEEARSISAAEADKRAMLSRIHSYDDIFTEIDKFLDDRGYYIKWQSRPDNFNTSIKVDYFDQPDINQNDEGIYVGWEGTFKGQLYNKDGTNAYISFWDLAGDKSGIYNLSFLKCDRGNWGSGFNVGGAIFVEDFPNLFKEYHNKGFDGRYNVLIQQQIDNIICAIHADENALVDEDTTINELTMILDSIGILEKKVKTTRDLHRTYLRKKFQSEVTVDLPTLEIPFVNLKKYNQFKDKYKKPLKDEAHIVDVSEFKDALNDIRIKADKYIAKYAEHFI